jgi:hypothetical protein
MAKYLGETDITVLEEVTYSRNTIADWINIWITKYSGIESLQTQFWLVDQIARINHGTKVRTYRAEWDDGTVEIRFKLDEPTESYKLWVEEMLGETYSDGSREYDYNTGVNNER